MIEKTILDHLASALDVPCSMERPAKEPVSFVLLEKTGNSCTNRVCTAILAVQSYGSTLYEAACLNEDVKRAMNAAAARLLRYDDFTSFAKLNSNNKTNLCHIVEARWHKDESGAVFVFSADRFLRNMVRAVVGTLVDVGRGRLSVEQFDEIVAARDLSRSSGSAPAQGLFLYDILYPADVFMRKWRRNDSGPLAPLTLCDM